MHSEVHVEGKQRGEHLNQVSLPLGDALGGDQDTLALTWLHTRFIQNGGEGERVFVQSRLHPEEGKVQFAILHDG